MSGHSKWATIRRKKEKVDAARAGGGDPGTNIRLRSAIQAAKDANMPQANIDKAVKRGTGELPGVNYEEGTLEGYAPGGVALLIEVLTDNRNRTTAEIRHILTKHGGRLGEAGCVAWMFEQRGLLTVEASALDEETLMDAALEFGADDIRTEDTFFEVQTRPDTFHAVREGLVGKGIEVQQATLAKVPQNTVTPEEKDAARVLKIIDAIEDHDDVQHVFSNFDAPLDMMAVSYTHLTLPTN